MAEMNGPKKYAVSLVLITYNQEAYVGEALAAVLAQDCEPMEIVVSDDHSTDATWEKITASLANYDGPHRIVLNRNRQNLGINLHFNVICGRLPAISSSSRRGTTSRCPNGSPVSPGPGGTALPAPFRTLPSSATVPARSICWRLNTMPGRGTGKG